MINIMNEKKNNILMKEKKIYINERIKKDIY